MYYFDIWEPAAIKGSTINKKDDNKMEVDGIIKKKQMNNKFWALGTDDEDEGF